MLCRETCSLLCKGNYEFRYTSKLIFFYKYEQNIVKYNSINVKNVIRNLVGKNNNSIANYIFYLTKKSDQSEDGSKLEPKHVVERNNGGSTL
jgi:hypothetical protein